MEEELVHAEDFVATALGTTTGAPVKRHDVLSQILTAEGIDDQRTVTVRPFEIIESAYSPFAPSKMEDEELATCMASVGDGDTVFHGGYIVPELIFDRLKGLQGPNKFTYNLSDESSRTKFINDYPYISKLFENGTSVILFIENLEALNTLSARERFDLNGKLRGLEDRLHTSSLILCSIASGRQLLAPATSPDSPFGLSMEKKFFTGRFESEIPAAEPRCVSMLSELASRPRSSLDLIQGSGRSRQFEKIMERWEEGTPQIVTGPRRGGKTSLVHTATKRLAEKGITPIDVGSLATIKRKLIDHFFDDSERAEARDYSFQVIGETIREKIASGKRFEPIYFISDEVLIQGFHVSDETLKEFLDYCELLKDVREERFPIHALHVLTDFGFNEFEQRAMQVRTDRDAVLSAYHREQFGLLSHEGSKECLEQLAQIGGIQFSNAGTHKRWLEYGSLVSGGSPVLLNEYAYQSAKGVPDMTTLHRRLRIGRSLDANLFDIYFQNMNPLQRKLCWSIIYSGEGLEFQNNSAEATELEQLVGRDLVKTEQGASQNTTRYRITNLPFQRSFLNAALEIQDKMLDESQALAIFFIEYLKSVGITDNELELAGERYVFFEEDEFKKAHPRLQGADLDAAIDAEKERIKYREEEKLKIMDLIAAHRRCFVIAHLLYRPEGIDINKDSGCIRSDEYYTKWSVSSKGPMLNPHIKL